MRLQFRYSIIPMGLVFSFVGACEGPSRLDQPTSRDSPAGLETEPVPAPDRQPEKRLPRAEMVGETLLYRVQWDRAEELAETLRPFLEQHYGPGVIIIPQRETNTLLIKLPPRSREPSSSSPQR